MLVSSIALKRVHAFALEIEISPFNCRQTILIREKERQHKYLSLLGHSAGEITDFTSHLYGGPWFGISRFYPSIRVGQGAWCSLGVIGFFLRSHLPLPGPRTLGCRGDNH